MATIKPPPGMQTARDVMATRLTTVSPSTDVATAIGLLVKHNVSGMPAVDDQGQYVGVFSEKSCLRALTHVAASLQEAGEPVAKAGDFMVTRLFCLSPQDNVFEAIGALLKHRVSGAPVVDRDKMLLGVFSEKDSMSVLIKAAYEQLPGADVSGFMNTDTGRIISDETDLLTIANRFVNTSYRRLPVVRDGVLQGQISRRDVLRNSRLLASIVRDIVASADSGGLPTTGDSAMRDVSSLDGESQRSDAAREQLSATCVANFLDADAKTVSEDVDLLTMAQIFSSTPYRRLPVIREAQLVGQVSRRDILASVYRLIEPAGGDRQQSLLYLSGVLRDGEAMPEIQ